MIETDSQLGDQRTVWMARRDAAFEAMMEHGRAEERAAATAINCAVIECPELGADAPARMLLPDSGGQVHDYHPIIDRTLGGWELINDAALASMARTQPTALAIPWAV